MVDDRIRRLIQLDDKDWDQLPKYMTGTPVYWHQTADNRIELWPRPIHAVGLYAYP